MKELSLVIIALVVIVICARYARADDMPADVLGLWCAQSSDINGSAWENEYVRNDVCEDHLTLEVSHTQLRGHEVGCRFSVVMKGGDAAYASAECSGDSCEWLSSILLYVEHGVLYVSGRNAKEKCFG